MKMWPRGGLARRGRRGCRRARRRSRSRRRRAARGRRKAAERLAEALCAGQRKARDALLAAGPRELFVLEERVRRVGGAARPPAARAVAVLQDFRRRRGVRRRHRRRGNGRGTTPGGGDGRRRRCRRTRRPRTRAESARVAGSASVIGNQSAREAANMCEFGPDAGIALEVAGREKGDPEFRAGPSAPPSRRSGRKGAGPSPTSGTRRPRPRRRASGSSPVPPVRKVANIAPWCLRHIEQWQCTMES